MEGLKNDVPEREDIRRKGKQLQGEVSQQIGATQKEISQRKDELSRYSPPKAEFFKLQAPNIDLRFNLKDPKLQAYEREAQKWFKEQPSIPVRIFNDGKDAVNWGIDLSKNLVNKPNIPKNGEPWPKPKESPFHRMP